MRRRTIQSHTHTRSRPAITAHVLRLLGTGAILAATILALALFVASREGPASAHPSRALTGTLSGSKSTVSYAKRVLSSDNILTNFWKDPVNGTAYTAGLTTIPSTLSPFEFTLPTGEQVSGTLPVVTLPDGNYEQVTSGGTTSTTLTSFKINLGPAATAGSCASGTLESDTPIPIDYLFRSLISSDGLAAAALFVYVSASDQAGVRQLCLDNNTKGFTIYQLSAGCTLTTCVNLAAQAGPSVTAYDTAVIADNWSQVWMLTSQQITAQYPESAFVTTLTQDSKSDGNITSISPPPPQPTIQYTPEKQAYFLVDQTVTVKKNGSSHTESITSYYLLEGGMWKFWFSA
jgi:hypothetical protein